MKTIKVVHLTQQYYGNQIKDDMGTECSIHARRDLYRIWPGNQQITIGTTQDLDRKDNCLKFILKKYGMIGQTGLILFSLCMFINTSKTVLLGQTGFNWLKKLLSGGLLYTLVLFTSKIISSVGDYQFLKRSSTQATYIYIYMIFQ